MKKPKGGSVGMVVAHIVCCGSLLLFVTGVLSFGTVVAWLGSGTARLAGIAILSVGVLAALVLLVRRGSFKVPAKNKTGEAGVDR